MVNSVTQRVACHLVERCGVGQGDGILAMVSGGADSTALLHILRRVHPGRIGVLSIDHGLRPEAAAEAEAVVSAARDLGLDAWCEQLGLMPGAGLQERARDARRAAAERLRDHAGFDFVATGHTANDQAETVLFRLARGTGRDGLTGMAWRHGRWIRPLLGLTRTETADWCRVSELGWYDDPSNRDPGFARSRVRHHLVPAMESVHPSAVANIVRAADLLRDEVEVIAAVVEEAHGRCAREQGLDVNALMAEPDAVQRLLIRRLVAAAGASSDARWIETARSLAKDRGAPRQIPGGVVAVDRGVLVVEPEAPVVGAGEQVLAVPGEVTFAGHRIRARRAGGVAPEPRCVAVAVDGPLTVRGPRPGDRLRLSNGHSARVGAFLASVGVPARHRPRVPLVVTGDRVVWVAGYRADPDLLVSPDNSATILEMT